MILPVKVRCCTSTVWGGVIQRKEWVGSYTKEGVGGVIEWVGSYTKEGVGVVIQKEGVGGVIQKRSE